MLEELSKPKMSYIPARAKQFKSVAIYRRVNTMHKTQEDRLENQIARLKHYVAGNPNWNSLAFIQIKIRVAIPIVRDSRT